LFADLPSVKLFCCVPLHHNVPKFHASPLPSHSHQYAPICAVHIIIFLLC
jgi:hypothetical protein